MGKNTSGEQINKDALVKRINRKLAKDGMRVRVSKRGNLSAFGKAYLIDTTRNNEVVGTHVDLISLAQKLNVPILKANAATA